ncbi:MAG: transketolase [Muribaculaceae bacterium]|nr:transketolase [Muribaculaceae bacterium]
MNDKGIMGRAADNIRILTAAMVEKAKSGHPGGAMGGADFINVLFSEYLIYDPADPFWKCRDRFFLDPGHMSPMLYSQLAMTGKYSLEELKEFRQWGSVTPGHPELDVARGIENTSGPLGQGHAYAVGAAIAAKFLEAHSGNPGFGKEKIYAYISDGGIQEEISQGAGQMAGHLGLGNLIMFYDANDIQLSTETKEVSSEDTAMKYRAWGWNVSEIDGNDVDQIRLALNEAISEKERPSLIIGHTIMGKGARKADNSSYERSTKTHGAPLGEGAYRNTVVNLGGDPDAPFVIFEEVKELYKARKEALEEIVAQRRKEEKEWAQRNPQKAGELDRWFEKKAPEIDWSRIEVKRDEPTRNASGAVLSQLALQVPNMVCSSADLADSDKTGSFLKNTTTLRKNDFKGAFLQAGVSELTMACLCIGMTLHGGLITACATFFVFSDYMKPAIRMAALMELPVKFVWSHDSFRVGEDGPTHEPVEHEAQIRLMEKMKNHSGRPSVLVLRPADVDETVESWKLAMDNIYTPTAIILSRQNVESLPEGNDYSGVEKGGYIVAGSDEDPDVVVIGTGSEVSTLARAASMLRKEGVKVQVVSVPSESLFRSQPKEYQDRVIPKGVKRFGLTAGLPVNLLGLVGEEGKIQGLESFGFSAPYKVLEEKLGFTPEQVYLKIKEIL